MFSKTAIAIVVAQCITTLGAALTTLFCFYRISPRLAYPAAIALIGFTASMHSVIFDTTLMSESLYCSLLIVSVGLVSLVIMRGGKKTCILASFAMAACLLTRPAGFFLFAVFGMVGLWLFFKRRQDVLPFALPLAITVLAICAYNKLTLDSFTVTPFGAINAIGAVATYVEVYPEAPEAVNVAVRDLRASVTQEDWRTILYSYDPAALSRVFSDYFTPAINSLGGKMGVDFMEQTKIYKRLAWRSIQTHPGLYLKFTIANFYSFYENALHAPDFYAEMPSRYTHRDAYNNLLPEDHLRDMLMEYFESPPQAVAADHWTRRMHERFNSWHAWIFSRAIWAWLAAGLFPISIWIFARRRTKHAFLAFVNLSMLLGVGAVVASVQTPMARYGATSLFICYLAPLLAYRSWLTDK
jgi:hypothetical protein